MKTKFTKLFTCVLGAVAVLCFSFAIMFMANNAYALESATIESTEIQESYALNTEFNVPEVTLKASDGTTVQADHTNAVLVFPDGIAYKALAHKLDQLGEYQLIYTTDTYTASKTFLVVRSNWSVTSNFSSAEYVDVLENSNLGKPGIKVNLADGETFTYHVPVNVNDVDVLDVIKAYPKISERSEGETGDVIKHAVFMTVRLVDCYDASNYIEFYLWAAPGGGYYLGAGAAYQTMTGLEYSSVELAASNTKRVFYNGGWYKRHFVTRYVESAQYGSSAGKSSFVGLCSVGGMNFQYNTLNNEVYRKVIYLNASKGYEYVTETRVITDLDAPELYADFGEEAFKGFTTGEVYLELQPKLMKSSSVEIEIESMFGREGEELLEYDYVENVAPVIDIDVNPTNESGINIPVGETYTIPSATVYDINYLGNLKSAVYYNYGEANQSQVLSKDGQFVPSREGTYTIEYTATDIYGNVGVSVLKVNAINQPAISIDEAKVEKLYAGEMNQLPEQNPVNINGDIDVEIYAISPLGEKIKIDSATNSFEPQVLGTYEIHYVLTDNVYNIDWSYEVECVDEHTNIRFYDQITLPPYFIKNATYTLDDYYAYTIDENGRVPHLTDVYVSIDGGAERKLSSEEIAKFVITGSENVSIVYQYGDTRTEPVTVEIIDANYNTNTAAATRMKYTDYAKYFVGDWTRMEANFTTMGFFFDGTKDTEVVEYANVISLNNFEFTINGSAPWTKDYHEDGSTTKTMDLTNYKKLEIKLTDYMNYNNTFVMSYEQKATDLIYTVQGESTTFASTDMSTVMNTIKANSFKGIITNTNGITTNLPKFEGDRCLLTITLSGITGESAFGIRRIGNQAFNKSMGKPAEAQAYYGISSGTLAQNTIYTITPCVITNVLHPTLGEDVTLTVTDPNKNVIQDVNGLTLDGVPANVSYDIRLPDVGFYTVTYIKKIATGESKDENYPINVGDSVCPVVEFADGLDETKLITITKGTKGWKHYIREFTVTDNLDTITGNRLYYSVTIFKAAGQIEVFLDILNMEDPSYTFTKTGYYKVALFATDSAGNSTWSYYNVLVK